MQLFDIFMQLKFFSVQEFKHSIICHRLVVFYFGAFLDEVRLGVAPRGAYTVTARDCCCASRSLSAPLPPRDRRPTNWREKAPAPLQPPAPTLLLKTVGALCTNQRAQYLPAIAYISHLLTRSFHQSEASRWNSNTCCSPAECVQHEDRQRGE